MRVVDVALADIMPYEKNPRINDGAIDAVAKSIKAYGFLQPLVLDFENVIVVGHTRYKAAKKLGLGSVPCIILDEGELTPDEVRAYRIADNKTSDLSIWDNKKLLDELEGLDDFFTGFELGDVFDHTEGFLTDIDVKEDNSVLEDNVAGVAYVLRVTSADKRAIEELEREWQRIRGRDANA